MFAVTFYSFKGGVGRTLAAVNVAGALAESGRKVLLVDFDLEAPGISYLPDLAPASGQGHPGVAEFLAATWETRKTLDPGPYIYRPPEYADQLSVMPAGDVSGSSFLTALRKLHDRQFFLRAFDREQGAPGLTLFQDLRRAWQSLGFEYVVIDSRTGLTDIGGVCTRLLPDLLVVLFALSQQGLDGMAKVVRQAEGGTLYGDDVTVLKVASMLPQGEDELVRQREAPPQGGVRADGRYQAADREPTVPAGRRAALSPPR